MKDKELIIQFQNGNEQAFTLLVNNHQQRLLTFLFKKTQEIHLAKDILQESWIKVCSELKKGNYYHENFAGWVTRLVNNKLIDHYRKNKNVEYVEFLEYFQYFNHIENYSYFEKKIEKMKKYVESLPKTQREVVQMRWLSGHNAEVPYITIANQLGIEEATARQAAFNAQKKLRILMKA